MRFLIYFLAFSFVFSVIPAKAEDGKLPIPRFVSLRSDEVNVRTGPGQRYKSKWVFRKAELPIEIIAEFEQWRKIRDSSGDEGWVHRSMLSGKRTALVYGNDFKLLRKAPEEKSPLIAKLEPGVIGSILECSEIWCRISVHKEKGWLKKTDLWGVYEREKID